MKSSLMNSSFKKLRGLAHQKSKAKDKREQQQQQQQRRPHAKQDELLLASQDMQDMRDCYDSLLSAAAATANSAYEFSEALQEMGSCLLEKTSLNDDEDGGKVLLMLGKVQFLLQKLVDNYRAHIIQTITTPSESHLKELQTLEDMKRQCDYKRDSYNAMVAAHKEKGRLKNTKGETITLQQLQSAQEEYEEEATQFIFRLKSLKKGQSRSLLTQAARHHAAQLNFFRKGLTALDVVEPHVKTVAERQHIDYQFSGLEDNGSEDDDDHSYDGSDDGELSFDYGQNEQGQDVVSTSRNLMELDSVDQAGAPISTMESAQETVDRSQAEFLSFSRGPGAGSQSAPILSNMKFDSSEKTKEMQPSSERKFRTYVLPTPVAVKTPSLAGSGYPVSAAMLESKSGWPTQLWHSSPLEPDKFLKDPGDEPSNPNRLLKGQLVLKESNINCDLKMPPPLAEELSLPQLSSNVASDAKKIKRQAFSGPLTDKTHSSKPMFSAIESRHSVDCPPVLSSKPTRVSTPQRSASPPPISSPKISELHELPRPPIILGTSQRPSSLIGHSAPLVSRGHEHSATSKIPSGQKASPLPIPPKSMARCFSIPSSGQRTPPPSAAKFLETPHNLDLMEEVASPTLSPMSLPTKHPV